MTLHRTVCLLVTGGLLAGACARSERRPSDTASAAATVPPADTSLAAAGAVPATVDSLGARAEDLYDVVKAGQWAKASTLVDSLRAAVEALPPSTDADTRRTLRENVDFLRQQVAGRRRVAATAAANRVTYASAQLVRAYTSPTPVQVLLLDYEGRELEIWSAQNDMAKLATTKTDLRRLWNEVRPQVAARNAAQASHTDSLVARIESARTASAVRALAKPFLDEVDLLEKVFTGQ